jgi:hypothetical protein
MDTTLLIRLISVLITLPTLFVIMCLVYFRWDRGKPARVRNIYALQLLVVFTLASYSSYLLLTFQGSNFLASVGPVMFLLTVRWVRK